MEFSAQQIAEILGGTVDGNSAVKVSTLSKIEEGKVGSLSFLSNPKYEQYIYTTAASIVIVAKGFKADKKINSTLIRVNDPYLSFTKLLEFYNQLSQKKPGIDPKAIVAESAHLGKDAYVGPGAIIGEHAQIGAGAKIYSGAVIGDKVKIGERTTVFSTAVIYQDCVVGSDCTLHSGVIVGGDGFGFAPQDKNNYVKVPQIGNVIIEDNVEIGANTTIDRATMGSTIIRKGVKLDNLIQIAHNVEIGEHTVIAAQTGISGSTKIGKYCMIGGQVGIVGHLIIADEVKIAAQSGIGKNITKVGEIVQGSPAFGIGGYTRSYVGFRKLPEILHELNILKKELEGLKEKS